MDVVVENRLNSIALLAARTIDIGESIILWLYGHKDRVTVCCTNFLFMASLQCSVTCCVGFVAGT